MKRKPAFSTVILAAGNSSRMNFPKPFLPFDDKRSFIEKIIDTYMNAGIRDIILVINEKIEKRLRLLLSMNYEDHMIMLIVNRFPERGRFYSIQQGLKNVKCRFCFIQNIDNPFITEVLLNDMMKGAADANYVVPGFQNKEGHPVLLSNKIVRNLLLLKGDDHNLRNELKCFSKITVNWPNEYILANINTREEYRKYFMPGEVYAGKHFVREERSCKQQHILP